MTELVIIEGDIHNLFIETKKFNSVHCGWSSAARKKKKGN